MQYTPFREALQIGQAAEQAILAELRYHGVEVAPTAGKHPFDFVLPGGQTAEVKLDLFSMRTSNGCIEFPSLNRGADLYFHCFTYCRVYTYEQYWELYRQGKIPAYGLGEAHYDGRYIPKGLMRQTGMFLDEFIKTLKE